MSIEQYQQARQLIAQAGGGDFDGAKPEPLVQKAEAALGLVFPPSYRRFLVEMGCGNIKSFEVLGLTDDNFENASVPNGIWLTLTERRERRLAPAYVLVGEVGDGSYYALDTQQLGHDAEAPVYVLSIDGEGRDKVADSFGAYFLDRVRRVL